MSRRHQSVEYGEPVQKGDAPAVEQASVSVGGDPETDIFIDKGASGVYSPVPKPEGWDNDRRINLHGRNYEVVAVRDDGGWCYRAM